MPKKKAKKKAARKKRFPSRRRPSLTTLTQELFAIAKIWDLDGVSTRDKTVTTATIWWNKLGPHQRTRWMKVQFTTNAVISEAWSMAGVSRGSGLEPFSTLDEFLTLIRDQIASDASWLKAQ
jgi:hypothetical protein